MDSQTEVSGPGIETSETPEAILDREIDTARTGESDKNALNFLERELKRMPSGSKNLENPLIVDSLKKRIVQSSQAGNPDQTASLLTLANAINLLNTEEQATILATAYDTQAADMREMAKSYRDRSDIKAAEASDLRADQPEQKANVLKALVSPKP
jgi:hypothetical protein